MKTGWDDLCYFYHLKQNLRRAYISLTNTMFPSEVNSTLQKQLLAKSKKNWESPEKEDVKDLYLVFNMQGSIKKLNAQYASEKQNKGKR